MHHITHSLTHTHTEREIEREGRRVEIWRRERYLKKLSFRVRLVNHGPIDLHIHHHRQRLLCHTRAARHFPTALPLCRHSLSLSVHFHNICPFWTLQHKNSHPRLISSCLFLHKTKETKLLVKAIWSAVYLLSTLVYSLFSYLELHHLRSRLHKCPQTRMPFFLFHGIVHFHKGPHGCFQVEIVSLCLSTRIHLKARCLCAFAE